MQRGNFKLEEALEVSKKELIEFITPSSKNKEYSIDTRYIDNYSNICPVCKRGLKVDNGVVRGVEDVSIYTDNTLKELILTIHCQQCEAELFRGLPRDKQNIVYSKLASSFIFNVLGLKQG